TDIRHQGRDPSDRDWALKWHLKGANVKIAIAVVVGISWLWLASTSIAAVGKEKESAGQTVDTGTFGVFMNGRRVATEKFSVQQNTGGSVASSEFKTEQGVDQAAQSSELQLTASGDLRK